jgi:hypothetical protein
MIAKVAATSVGEEGEETKEAETVARDREEGKEDEDPH